MDTALIIGPMAVSTGNGDLLLLPDERRVGGGPCALVERRDRDGRALVHGTCILQRLAIEPTPLDPDGAYRLRLGDGRLVDVRIVKHTMSACGPEIVRFEGPADR